MFFFFSVYLKIKDSRAVCSVHVHEIVADFSRLNSFAWGAFQLESSFQLAMDTAGQASGASGHISRYHEKDMGFELSKQRGMPSSRPQHQNANQNTDQIPWETEKRGWEPTKRVQLP